MSMMAELRVGTIREIVNSGLQELYGLWEEIGLDETTQNQRSQTVEEHFKGLLARMIKEENGLKKRLVESLEYSMKQCIKLSKELGMSYEEPDSKQALIKLEHALRAEAKRLETAREARMAELLNLRRCDECLCQRLGVDPYYVPSSTVPSSQQLESLKDHIRSLEEEKFTRLEQYVKIKDSVVSLFMELEAEPESDFEREVACEDIDRFVLSNSNLSLVRDLEKSLQERLEQLTKDRLEVVAKLESLYERLQLDESHKSHFLSVNQGHGPSVMVMLRKEVERLEEIKKGNLEKFITNLRNELHKLWDDCFYTQEQRDRFSPLHSTDFTEELLETHETELVEVKKYFQDNKELLTKVAERQEVWNKFMELERRAKDPSRLLNARGTNLLIEEKERNKVNKALPRVEQELERLITDWEAQHKKQFLVSGVSFKDFIEVQKEDHLRQLEAEKLERDKQKKEKLLQETRYGTKPSTPARLKGHNTSKMTPKRQTTTPTGSAKIMNRMSTAMARMSPRAGRPGKGIVTKNEGEPAMKKDRTLRGKRRSSYGIKKDKKNKKSLTAKETKIKRGILTETNYTINGNDSVIRQDKNQTLASLVSGYGSFKQGNILNSTESHGGRHTPEVTKPLPNYMTPTHTAQQKMSRTPNRTPTTPGSRSRSQLMGGTIPPKLSTLRSSKQLPFLI